MTEALLRQAAEAVSSAEALLVTAGAGMGVHSGLPDFRGDRGFWKAYPPYEKLGLSFVALASPRWFHDDPGLAWGFYGHRLNLYRATTPHDGFAILNRWARRMRQGAFVFTSNVDGHFQRAGFDPERVAEMHGSLDWLQCLRGCGAGLFPAAEAVPAGVAVDEATLRARPPLPSCPRCGGLARPNVLMFGEGLTAGPGRWDESRTAAQEDRLGVWLALREAARLAVVECGAGTAIPTVRRFGEWRAARGAALVRLNPREPDVPPGQVGLALGALAGLQALDGLLSGPRRGGGGAANGPAHAQA